MKEKTGKDYDEVPRVMKKDICCRKTGECSQWFQRSDYPSQLHKEDIFRRAWRDKETTHDYYFNASHNDHGERFRRIENNWWPSGLDDCCRKTGQCNQYFN